MCSSSSARRSRAGYLANIAAARLLASARCVEISFEVPFSHAASLSLRKSGSILDPRLPGGGATGKIKSYTIFANGSSGETGCRVTLGCTPGYGGSLILDPGTPGYVTDYVDSYQVYSGATQVLLTNGAGDAALTIRNFDGIVPNDDGLDLFNMRSASPKGPFPHSITASLSSEAVAGFTDCFLRTEIALAGRTTISMLIGRLPQDRWSSAPGGRNSRSRSVYGKARPSPGDMTRRSSSGTSSTRHWCPGSWNRRSASGPTQDW
jgi:hypothetical protein